MFFVNVAAFVIGLITGILELVLYWGITVLLFMASPLFGICCLVFPIQAIMGACLSFTRKRSGAYMLRVCAGWKILVFILFLMGPSFIENNFTRAIVSAGLGNDNILTLVFAIAYSVATFCAYGGLEENSNGVDNQSQTSKTSTPNSPVQEKIKTFEPVLGVETPALIKRAFMFIEENNPNEAERYFEQALRQDPENSSAYLGKLMIEQKVSNVDDLASLETPLNEKNSFSVPCRLQLTKKEKRLKVILKPKNRISRSKNILKLSNARK